MSVIIDIFTNQFNVYVWMNAGEEINHESRKRDNNVIMEFWSIFLLLRTLVYLILIIFALAANIKCIAGFVKKDRKSHLAKLYFVLSISNLSLLFCAAILSFKGFFPGKHLTTTTFATLSYEEEEELPYFTLWFFSQRRKGIIRPIARNLRRFEGLREIFSLLFHSRFMHHMFRAEIQRGKRINGE